MVNNMIKFNCKPSPRYGDLVPTIEFYFEILNDTPDPIVIFDVQYNVHLLTRQENYIGTGSIHTHRTNDGSLRLISIPSGQAFGCNSKFEIGFSKVNQIEKIRKLEKIEFKSNNIKFKIGINGILIKPDQEDKKTRSTDKNLPLLFGYEIRDIIITESEWLEWLNLWGRDIRILEISTDVERIIEELKQNWKITDNNDLILKIINYAGLFEKQPSPTREFYYNTIDEHSLKHKIENMIENAEEKIQISGWIDTTLLRNLKEKANKDVTIEIITKKPNDKSPASVKESYPKLVEFSEVKRNNKMHSRFIIVDKREILLWSGDFTSYSLTMNFEAGIWINENYFIDQLVNFFNKVWNSEDTKSVNEEMKK